MCCGCGWPCEQRLLRLHVCVSPADRKHQVHRGPIERQVPRLCTGGVQGAGGGCQLQGAATRVSGWLAGWDRSMPDKSNRYIDACVMHLHHMPRAAFVTPSQLSQLIDGCCAACTITSWRYIHARSVHPSYMAAPCWQLSLLSHSLFPPKKRSHRTLPTRKCIHGQWSGLQVIM